MPKKLNLRENSSAEYLRLFYNIGTLLFICLYIWANFFNRHAFNVDMYTDAQVAEMIWEQKTLFPEGWIFGNQYYVIATPVLAAIFYGMIGDSITALGAASSVMTLLILLLFVWMIKPFTEKTSRSAGLFAISGAVILGISVCQCTTGMQIFYTMASYYACYLIGILLTLGVYFRMRMDIPVSRVLILLSLAVEFCLGIQSPRETLVLILPLMCVCTLDVLTALITKIRSLHKASLVFTSLSFAANAAGLAAARFVSAEMRKEISPMHIPVNFSELSVNIHAAMVSFKEIIGIGYFDFGLKWVPLAAASVLICVVNAVSVIRATVEFFRALKRKESADTLTYMIIYCAVSILAVFAVGILLSFSLRGIYFFTWYLLAALSFVYIFESFRPGTRSAAALILACCGCLSLFYNAYPDIVQYSEQSRLFNETADSLYEEGYDLIYVDMATHQGTAIAACSENRIQAGTIVFDISPENGCYIAPYDGLRKAELFEERSKFNPVVVLSVSHLSSTSAFAELEANPEYKNDIMSKLNLLRVESNSYYDSYIYEIVDYSVFGQQT